MTTYVDMYNNLPTLGEADDRFVRRNAMFAKLAPLLSKYGNRFGVCLVHSHCTLEPGETMIATGNVCQPEDSTFSKSHYPERWLASGEPFEFTTEPTPSPPAELFDEFQKVAGESGVLGLYSVKASAGILQLEWTEGRKNITKVVSELDPRHVETAWLPGTEGPLQMGCLVVCNYRLGHHKGTKSHYGRC